MGNLDIEQGIIHGQITYHTDFRGQGHGWKVHSPFDEHASRSKSDKNDIIGVSSTAYAIEWTGDLVHPGNGYDGPRGGGHPTPTGARDEYTYKVKGIADSVNIDAGDSFTFMQRMKNRYNNAIDIFGGVFESWDKATTHNPNLNRVGNVAEVGNAVITGAGSVLGAGWEMLGMGDINQAAGLARDNVLLGIVQAQDAEGHLATVNSFVEKYGEVDDYRKRFERWKAENPNAAELVGLGWNAMENILTRGKGKGDTPNANSVDSSSNWGSYRPDRYLPRDKHGNPIPDSDYPHTQLGKKDGRHGEYTQGREWGDNGNGDLEVKKDIDFTNHNRADHPNPHQHIYSDNETGGTRQRGKNPLPLD